MHILKRKKKVIYSMYRDYLKMEEVEVIDIGITNTLNTNTLVEYFELKQLYQKVWNRGQNTIEVDYENLKNSKWKKSEKNPTIKLS